MNDSNEKSQVILHFGFPSNKDNSSAQCRKWDYISVKLIRTTKLALTSQVPRLHLYVIYLKHN